MKPNCFLFLCFTVILSFSVSYISAQIPVTGIYTVYYGSLHNHTNVSDGTGTPDQAYQYARDVAGLDFFGLSDHSNLMSSTEWTTIKNAANYYNKDGDFAAFYGFEWTTYLSYGHVSIVGTEDYCSTGTATSTFTKLLGWLNARNGIAFFNHPGWDAFSFNEFNHFTDTPSDKLVGMELWNDNNGFSKYYYNDGYYSNDGGKGYFDEALIRKWKVGAAGADDNHDADWGTANPYRVGVLASNLTRAEIMEAFKARRYFSTIDKDITMSFKINGAEMGSTIAGGNLNFQIQAKDGDPNEIFTQVVLIKNGAVLKSWPVYDSWPIISEFFTCSNGDYFYVRVKQLDGGEAISSPIWISGTANQPPTVSITSPVSGSYPSGQSFTISANAVDADGTIASVEFYLNGTLLVADNMAPYEYPWTPADGSYSLTAKAYDNLGASAAAAPVSVTVVSANQPPVVSLTSPANGATFAEGVAIPFAATASDPEGSMGRVEFYQGTTLLSTDATSPYDFQWTGAAPGTYSLKAVAYDIPGASATSSSVAITVTAVTPGVINAPISMGSDDAEEYANKTVKLTDVDIDLVYDSKTSGNQTVGLYFRNLNIPAGATIKKAYIQFTSYKKTTNSCLLTIKGETSASPATFTAVSGNLSSRTKTNTSVSWTPVGWTTVGSKGTAQQTSDIIAIIQEIVNSYGGTNNLVIFITGTGTRTAYSYETSTAHAAILHVEYDAPAQQQQVLKSLDMAVKNPSVLSDQPVQEVNVQLYPNPVTGKLNIRLTGDAYLEQLEIYSVHGVLIVQRKLNGLLRETSVDCTEIIPGTYVVVVKTTQGNYPLKFVRQ